MSDWAAWSLQGEPLALARYVLPDEVARYVQLPGPSGDSVTTRLRAVYAALARLKIGYAYDAPDADPGRQVIRPPDQVLWAPRHATCLDLAVVLAGACLKAGLHPIIVILDPPDGHGPAHSLVLVRLDRGRHTQRTGGALGQHVWLQPPEALLDDLQHGLDAPPGNVLAVDPVGVAVCLGTAATRGLDVDLDAAVTGGARYLTQWRWRLGIDVGSAWSKEATQRPDARPDVEPLREPYRSADTAESPLRLLRAEYGLVPFQRRDELTVLRDWCQQVAAGDRTGLAVVTGVGGSGKTRLALHLAQLLRAEGWYAGVLPRGSSGVGWLAGVVSPVLVVLDYADGRTDDAKALLKALRSHCGPPAVVLCTARSLEGEWLAEIVASLDDDRHAYRREDVTLPDTHPDALDVYHRTVAKMAGAAATVEAPHPPRGIRWTTLDFVLLGWVAAQGATALPASRRDLYDHALVHEEQYWSTVYSDKVKERQPSRARLRKAAVCLSLVAPVEREADGVLRAVPDLAEDARERHDVRDTLVSCFRSEAGEGLALRPDPVGDHLLLRELAQEPGLLQRALREAGEGKLEQALVTLTRAGQTDAEASTRLIMGLLQHDPSRWMAALSVATAQGGAALAALERLAARKEMPLPLDELSEAVPFSSLALYDLGLTVDQRRLDAARAAGATREVLANLLMAVSERAGNAGDRAAALAAITEAVDHYRALAQANPAAFLPDLAMSLNNLSNQQSATGDRAAALAAITEAVDHYRALAQANPAAFLPNLATSLNNLSDRLSEAGKTGVLAPTWGTAIAPMTCQAARAELRAAWSARLASDGLLEEAREELRRAAREADAASENEPIIVLERARHAIRSLAQTLGPAHDGLPVWAIAALPDRHVQLVDAVAHAADWPALHAALAQHADALSAPELRVTLRALADLFPGNTAPRQLQDLLDEVEAHGLDTFIDAQQTNYERRVLLTAWIATPTWSESLEYFRQHQAELTTDEIWDLLAESDDHTALQHLAILDLAHATSAGDAYAIVADTAMAEDAAFAAIEEGDLARLTTIAIAAPALQNRPTTWGLIDAILHLAQDDRESAYAALHAVTDQGSLMLRRAHSVRLRALQRHHPDLDGLDRLLEIISQENAQT